MASVNIKPKGSFPINNKKCYVNWDAFCVGSLNSAKEEINTKRIFRYKEIEDAKTEEARLAHVTSGITDIAEFIEKYGWKIFVAVAIGFAATIGGAVATSAGGIIATSAGGTIATYGGGIMALIVSNPITAVGAGIALTGGAIVVSYYGYKLYKHKELVVKVKNILSPIKGSFLEYQPGNTKYNMPKIQVLFNTSVVLVIEKIYECEIMVDDLSLPIHPICLCGAVLTPKLNTECYGDEYSMVICDVCDKQIYDKKDVFHCSRKKIRIHPHGYDVCIICAREYNEKFKRYHAVIIQTIPENGNVQCKDANVLKLFFESLNYHSVIVIKPNKASKKNIENVLKKMSLNNKNDVVVICYSGHGNKVGNHWKCYLKNDEPMTDQELVESIKCNNNIYKSFGATCDIVIFLNACHSGNFQVEVDDEKVQFDDEKMPKYLLDYDELGRNMITIAACASNEEGNFVGEISPFYKLVMEAMKNNKNATPDSVHKYVKQKSKNTPDLPFTLADFQNVQKAFKKGGYALYVPLCPAVKKY
eukprot:916805_1